MNYNIDIPTYLSRILKRELRQPKLIALLGAVLKPFKDVNDEFVTLSNDTKYLLQFNGQTIYLEHYLNDQHDEVLRRIYIVTVSEVNRVAIYFKTEGQAPLYIYRKSELETPVYIRRKTEAVSTTDFIVYVPSDITFDETAMRAQIDQFKQAGKTYIIQTY